MIKYIVILLMFLLPSCDFFNNDDESNENQENDDSINLDEYFSFNISNQLAYYFFDTVLVNNELLDSTDWVAAFKGDICVGAQQWTCQGTCDVPIYGEYSLNEETDGYMLPGEFPSFKIYDSSEDTYYDAVPSNQIAWQDGLMPVISSLVSE